ncbi:MAG: MFS transporter [Peptococcaceae bacterium]|nr:MFS transporter [Peptococcaceae bacterium]
MPKERRSLYLLYATTFFIFLNFYNAQTITPVYILHVGGSEFFSGLQSTMFFLAAVLLRFYFGPLADKKGTKLTLYIGAAAFATAPFLFLFSQNIWYILAVRTYQSIGLAAFFSSCSSLVSALAPREKMGKYIGFYRLVTMSTLMIGPPLALRVINSFGYQVYHSLGGVIGVIAIGLLYFVKEPHPRESAGSGGGVPERYHMLDLMKDKKLVPIYLTIFVVSVSYGLLLTFTAIYIERFLPGVNPGIFFTLFGLGCLVSNLIAGSLSDRIGRAAVVIPCVLIMGMGISIFYFLPYHSVILYAGSVLSGIGYAGSIAVLITWIVDVINPARRTTALALQDSSIDIGIALGSFLFGVLVPMIGMPLSFGLSGMLLLVYALWKITAEKTLRSVD